MTTGKTDKRKTKPPAEDKPVEVTTPTPDTTLSPEDIRDVAARNPVAGVVLATPDPVEKDQTNEFADYQYASADAVYAHVRAEIAKLGLSVWQDEIAFEVVEGEKNKSWLKITYELGFDDKGEKPAGPLERRTILIQYTGVQTCQAAVTYGLKYWLKGKFQLPTGEQEADAEAYTKTRPPAVAMINDAQIEALKMWSKQLPSVAGVLKGKTLKSVSQEEFDAIRQLVKDERHLQNVRGTQPDTEMSEEEKQKALEREAAEAERERLEREGKKDPKPNKEKLRLD